MKNLKKVLALGLALVMILGMFTIASAAETKKTAADFTDWDKVEHKDAVALCVDLGIINGLPDGSFAPDQTLDRASWAKLVYFTATGDDNADAYLGTATDLKDITGNWAESYISYLYATGRVSGDGTGNYMPNGTVTVAAGLKTMLTVLGYDADSEGYQGTAAWAGNVITDAKTNGLMDEIDRSNTANVALTRDNAAQIVYNTLQADRVKPTTLRDQGTSYVASYAPNGQLLKDVFDTIPVTATVSDVNDGVATFADATPSDALSALNNAEVKAAASNIGNKVTVFVHTNKKDVVSTAVAKAGTAADKTFTDDVTIANITTKNNDDKDHFVAAAADDIKYYLNGEEKSLAAEYKGGNVVEVYLTSGKVSMIKVTTYTVAKITDDVETRTYKDDEQVKVPGAFNGFKNVDVVDGWQGLAKDDIVLVNVSKGVTYLEKAESINGKVTLRSGAKLTVNGKQYAQSGIADAEVDFANWNVKNEKDNEYDFYLDKNGDVCYQVLVSGEVTTEVAYVLEAKYLSNAGTVWSSSDSLQANLLFTDGTTQIVTIAKVGDKDKDFADTDATGLEGKMVDFSVNSKGNYELTVKTAKDGISAGKVSVAPEFHEGLKADNATVFLIAKGNDDDGFEYSVVTGYKNVPAMTAAKVVAVEDDGIVTYIYLETPKFDGEGSDGLIYVQSIETDVEDTAGNKIYEIVDANGNKTTMALTGVEPAAQTFYVIDSIDENDVATIKAVGEGVTDMAAAPTVGKGIVTVGEKAYATDSSTVCVVIDIDDGEFVDASGMNISSFKAEDGYTYTGKLIVDGDNAEYIYIVRTTVAAAPQD